MKVGPAQPLYAHIVALQPLAANWRLGAVVSISEAKGAQSDLQRKGFHWLLHKWMYLDRGAAQDFEDLKSKVLISQWGAIKVTDQHGNETFAPVKRTTQEWDWDAKSYVDKPCTREEYTELIATAYRLGPAELPEMKKKYLAL